MANWTGFQRGGDGGDERRKKSRARIGQRTSDGRSGSKVSGSLRNSKYSSKVKAETTVTAQNALNALLMVYWWLAVTSQLEGPGFNLGWTEDLRRTKTYMIGDSKLPLAVRINESKCPLMDLWPVQSVSKYIKYMLEYKKTNLEITNYNARL